MPRSLRSCGVVGRNLLRSGSAGEAGCLGCFAGLGAPADLGPRLAWPGLCPGCSGDLVPPPRLGPAWPESWRRLPRGASSLRGLGLSARPCACGRAVSSLGRCPRRCPSCGRASLRGAWGASLALARRLSLRGLPCWPWGRLFVRCGGLLDTLRPSRMPRGAHGLTCPVYTSSNEINV